MKFVRGWFDSIRIIKKLLKIYLARTLEMRRPDMYERTGELERRRRQMILRQDKNQCNNDIVRYFLLFCRFGMCATLAYQRNWNYRLLPVRIVKKVRFFCSTLFVCHLLQANFIFIDEKEHINVLYAYNTHKQDKSSEKTHIENEWFFCPWIISDERRKSWNEKCAGANKMCNAGANCFSIIPFEYVYISQLISASHTVKNGFMRGRKLRIKAIECAGKKRHMNFSHPFCSSI